MTKEQWFRRLVLGLIPEFGEHGMAGFMTGMEMAMRHPEWARYALDAGTTAVGKGPWSSFDRIARDFPIEDLQ